MDVQPMTSTASPQQGLIEYTHWIYALHALAVVSALLTSRGVVALRFAFSLPSIIAVIMNYARRSQARSSWLETHFSWQIRTFWFAVLWIIVISIVSIPMMLVIVGFFFWWVGLSMIGLWVVYRVIRGWIALREARPMPLPMT